MIPDRFAPTLDVDRFIDLVNEYGYNDLKRFGIQAGLTGVLVAATAIGIGYALVTERRSSRSRGPQVLGTSLSGLLFVAAAFVLLYGGIAGGALAKPRHQYDADCPRAVRDW